MIEIEHRAKEDNGRKEDDHRAYHLVEYSDACGVESATNLIDQPRESIPPQQCTCGNAGKAHARFDGTGGLHKRKLREGGHEKEDNQGVGERDEKRR